jgi:hypothetical protein
MAWPSSAHKSVGACARKGVRLLVGKHVGAVANGMALFCAQERGCLREKGHECGYRRKSSCMALFCAQERGCLSEQKANSF